MDISALVDYEFLYSLELRNPVTDAPLGITFSIRSAGSEAAKKVLREHTDRNLERRIKNKSPTSDQLVRDELEKVASYVASWDWGSNIYEGAVPVLSMKSVTAMLEKQDWIYSQVAEAATKLANFSQRSPKVSVKK